MIIQLSLHLSNSVYLFILMTISYSKALGDRNRISNVLQPLHCTDGYFLVNWEIWELSCWKLYKWKKGLFFTHNNSGTTSKMFFKCNKEINLQAMSKHKNSILNYVYVKVWLIENSNERCLTNLTYISYHMLRSHFWVIW